MQKKKPKLSLEEIQNKAIVARVRTKVFTGVNLTSHETDLIKGLWDNECKVFKKEFKSTWDIVVWDIVNNKGYSPKNYFKVHSRLEHLEDFTWIGDEVTNIHKKIFLDQIHADITTITLFRSKKIHIYVDTDAQAVFYEAMDGNTRTGASHVKGYEIKDLYVFNTIADQMISHMKDNYEY